MKADVIIQSHQYAIDEYPEWWYLHEGLGDWYKHIGENKSALQAYSEGLKHDTKEHHLSYWEVLSDIRKTQGDILGAVDALCECTHFTEEDKIWWYWKKMAEIYKEQKDYEIMKDIYHEAICMHPDNGT